MFNYNMHSGVVMGNEPSICHDDGPLVERINKLSQELFGTPVHKNYPKVIGLEVIEGAPADLLLNYSNNPVGPTNSLQTQVGRAHQVAPLTLCSQANSSSSAKSNRFRFATR